MSSLEKAEFIVYCTLRVAAEKHNDYDLKSEAGYITRVLSRKDDDVIDSDFEFYKAVYDGLFFEEFFGGVENE